MRVSYTSNSKEKTIAYYWYISLQGCIIIKIYYYGSDIKEFFIIKKGKYIHLSK